ncbi:MAG: hypothetical protein ABIA12_01735 [Candidatus Aenigmatarchaeota archaeon]
MPENAVVGRLKRLERALDIGLVGSLAVSTIGDAAITIARHGRQYVTMAGTITVGYEQTLLPKYLISQFGTVPGIMLSVAFDTAVYAGFSLGLHRVVKSYLKDFNDSAPAIVGKIPSYAYLGAATLLRISGISSWL